jgi:hypothetical protein
MKQILLTVLIFTICAHSFCQSSPNNTAIISISDVAQGDPNDGRHKETNRAGKFIPTKNKFTNCDGSNPIDAKKEDIDFGSYCKPVRVTIDSLWDKTLTGELLVIPDRSELYLRTINKSYLLKTKQPVIQYLSFNKECVTIVIKKDSSKIIKEPNCISF